MTSRTTHRPEPPMPMVPAGLPEIFDHTEDGWLRILAVNRPTVPLVEMRMAFPLSQEVLGHQAELAVLGESILGGTTSRDRGELASAIQRIGGHLSLIISKDRAVLSASALAEHFGELCALIVEVLEEPAYAKAVVAGDRRRVAEQIVLARSQPQVLVDEELDRRYYRGHPYRLGLPSQASVRRVSFEQLPALHSAVLERRGGVLVVVGDIEPERVLDEIGSLFGRWISSVTTPQVPVEPLTDFSHRPIELVNRSGAIQSNIRIGSPAPQRNEKEWPAAALANLAFGGLFSSRLVENLRERRGYTYSPHSSVEHLLAGSRMVIALEVGTEVTAPALAEVTYELARAALLGFDESEIEDARRYAIGSLALATATQSGLAAMLATLALDGLEPSYLEEYPKALKDCKPEDVAIAARRMLSPSATTTVILGDVDKIEGPLMALGPVSISKGPLTSTTPAKGKPASKATVKADGWRCS